MLPQVYAYARLITLESSLVFNNFTTCVHLELSHVFNSFFLMSIYNYFTYDYRHCSLVDLFIISNKKLLENCGSVLFCKINSWLALIFSLKYLNHCLTMRLFSFKTGFRSGWNERLYALNTEHISFCQFWTIDIWYDC